jgi:hypothetical protein
MDTALLVAIIGIGGTLAAQVIAWIRGHFADKARREHEQEMKRMELEEARQNRLREERIQAYTDLLRKSSSFDPNDENRLAELAEGYAIIQLVGGSEQAISHAKDLSDWGKEAWKRAWKVLEEGRDPLEDDYVQEAIEDMFQEREIFLKAAREDVGHTPNTTNT